MGRAGLDEAQLSIKAAGPTTFLAVLRGEQTQGRKSKQVEEGMLDGISIASDENLSDEVMMHHKHKSC
jgi:hypothetical protein